MDLGYGFVYGKNVISKEKICRWLHTEHEINWNAFLWYMADYCDIDDYGEDWFAVHLVSAKQREFFYKKAIDYSDQMASYNYIMDIENDLWTTHKKGAERNLTILQRLISTDAKQ